VLAADSALVPKHGGDTPLIFIYNEYCAFGWCNKLSKLYCEHSRSNGIPMEGKSSAIRFLPPSGTLGCHCVIEY
jgi:hypothetical protein